MPIIRVEMGSLKELENDLGQMKDKSKMALKAAINETARDLKKRLMSGARNRYKMSNEMRGKMTGANKVKSATTSRLEAELTITSGIGELYGYDVKPRGYVPGGRGRGTSTSGRVLKGSGYKQLALGSSGTDQYKAFVVKYKSGHIAVAQRVPGKRMKGGHKEAIKSLMANSITKNEEIAYREEEEAEMEDRLAEAIHRQVERYLPVSSGF